MKKIYFIYNPKSGKGQIGSKLNEIIQTLAKKNNELTVVPTICAKDALNRIQNLPEGYDRVVCSGGDGTLDEVVTGMMSHPRKKRIPIGYIPAGTTNDFAKSLNIPKNMVDAAKIAVGGKKFPCDIGKFNDDYFIYVAAFGLFTDVSYTTKQEFKHVLGHMAYVLEGMKRLYNVKSYKMKVSSDERDFAGEFLLGMVTNSKSVAGFEWVNGKNAKFDDGVFEVLFIKKPKKAIEIQEILAALLREEIDERYMYFFRTKRLVIEAENGVCWTLDGEFGGEHQRVEIENKPKQIDIIIKR